ncbi:MAG: cupin domain-containing protein [Acidimicrobiia bacterium]|nr:cupin domain-containing protein [Acidimicrobiia bacterium]
MDKHWHTVHSGDLEWQDDIDILDLGHGVQVKILFQDRDNQHTDMLVKFPPGYEEPRHNHQSSHSIIVLEGVQIAEGEPLQPGDYCWASGGRPHGPFEYPQGCVVFVSFRGPSVKHLYTGSPAGGLES